MLAKGSRRALQELAATPAAGYQLRVRPNGTKTITLWRSGSFTLTVTEDRQRKLVAKLTTHTSHMLADNTAIAT